MGSAAAEKVEKAPARKTVLATALIRPWQSEKQSPCNAGCATGADVRGWLGFVAQHAKLGLSREEACRKAWAIVAEVNPFPATLGRVCPHPCESGCNRNDADGPVAINAMERYLGDWAIEQGLALPVAIRQVQPESIGVIGAGPAGLSFAYQMARRGYRVTVYERHSEAGGMLRYGIPQYRLPASILEKEIARIAQLGVDIRLGVAVGKDIDATGLSEEHQVVFLGIGAGQGIALGIPGEDGPGAWTGIDYLSKVSRSEPVDLGEHAVIVGGGNTAIDAARAARRGGARVTVLYRRTRAEMPAIACEVEDAIAEGVQFEYLAAPVEVLRDQGRLRSLVVQRMALGEPDASGRRSPVPIPDSNFELPANTVIAAVSQQPDWDGLQEYNNGARWIRAALDGSFSETVYAGGDVLSPSIAGMAIAQGRRAAESVHARLRGIPAAAPDPRNLAKCVKADYYRPGEPARVQQADVTERLAQPALEVNRTITEEQFFDEASRCFSCGKCFGCEHCFMFCNPGGYTRLPQPKPGAYFSLNLDYCEACGKCIEVCPCGFLSPQ